MKSALPGIARGLHETLLTEALASSLEAFTASNVVARRSGLHEAEAADRLSLHLGRVLERALSSLDRKERVAIGRPWSVNWSTPLSLPPPLTRSPPSAPSNPARSCAACSANFLTDPPKSWLNR